MSRDQKGDEQLVAYEITAKITDQIIAFQNSLTTVANLFLLITGAIWAAIATDQLKLPWYASVAILGFHLISALATLQVIAANINAMKLRMAFLEEFREKYHPDIEAIGQNSFRRTFGSVDSFKARYARWGGQPVLLWYLMPIVAFVGSIYFLIRIGRQLL